MCPIVHALSEIIELEHRRESAEPGGDRGFRGNAESDIVVRRLLREEKLRTPPFRKSRITNDFISSIGRQMGFKKTFGPIALDINVARIPQTFPTAVFVFATINGRRTRLLLSFLQPVPSYPYCPPFINLFGVTTP